MPFSFSLQWSYWKPILAPLLSLSPLPYYVWATLRLAPDIRSPPPYWTGTERNRADPFCPRTDLPLHGESTQSFNVVNGQAKGSITSSLPLYSFLPLRSSTLKVFLQPQHTILTKTQTIHKDHFVVCCRYRYIINTFCPVQNARAAVLHMIGSTVQREQASYKTLPPKLDWIHCNNYVLQSWSCHHPTARAHRSCESKRYRLQF